DAVSRRSSSPRPRRTARDQRVSRRERVGAWLRGVFAIRWWSGTRTRRSVNGSDQLLIDRLWTRNDAGDVGIDAGLGGSTVLRFIATLLALDLLLLPPLQPLLFLVPLVDGCPQCRSFMLPEEHCAACRDRQGGAASVGLAHCVHP